MPQKHVVEQGESMYTIAKRFNFLNWRAIFDADENEDLRARRPNPQVLQPGDVVVIPDKEDPSIPALLDGRMIVARRKRGLQPLRIILQRPGGEPFANQDYQLSFDGGALKGKTDDKGLLREEVPVGITSAQLRIGRETHTLQIGFLDPLENASDKGIAGVQGRLRNLGFYTGPVDGKTNPDLTAAVKLFQTEHDLPDSGDPDQETLQKLLEIHGS